MLSGKKYPHNFRALRMLVEELLRDVVQKQGVASFAHLIETLDARARRSRIERQRCGLTILSRQSL